MWFLPYKKLILKTHLSKEQVTHKVREIIYIHSGIFSSFFFINAETNRPYHGHFDAYGFEICRLNHNDAYLPIIKGAIESEYGETNIIITMRPSTVLLGALVFLILFLCLFAERIMAGFLNSGGVDFNDFIGFGFIILIFYLFPVFVFNREAVRSKTFFQNLLEVYEVQESGLFNRENLA
jgi:hypothetical protein